VKSYFPFCTEEDTPIAVEFYQGSESVIPHCHDFFEFVFVLRGSCVHRYKNIESLLVPGDVFIIPPHCEHSYDIHSEITIVNCHFYPDKMDANWNKMFKSIISDEREKPEPSRRSYEEILNDITMLPVSYERHSHLADINSQGIIHLSTKESQSLEAMLKTIQMEQTNKHTAFEYFKQYYLGIILITLRRVQEGQCKDDVKYSSRKRKMIERAFDYIENHLLEKIDFNYIAHELNLSPNYFRILFKEVTGLSPGDYLNRLRIVKSLEYLQKTDCSISDAAAQVGIYDANYFSRLFRKIMGYSPTYFKKKLGED